MSSWSLEPPPVKIISVDDRSTTRGAISAAWLPTPGVFAVQPRPPPLGHVYRLSQSSPVHPSAPNAPPQVAALASPSIWKMPSLCEASASDEPSASVATDTAAHVLPEFHFMLTPTAIEGGHDGRRVGADYASKLVPWPVPLRHGPY